jgi:hypothetical protein
MLRQALAQPAGVPGPDTGAPRRRSKA